MYTTVLSTIQLGVIMTNILMLVLYSWYVLHILFLSLLLAF